MTPPPAPAKANTGAIIAFVCLVVVAVVAVVVTLVLVNGGSGSSSDDSGGGAATTPGGTVADGEAVAQGVVDAINENDPDAVNAFACDAEAARRIKPLITSLEKTEPVASVGNNTEADGKGTANVTVANLDGTVSITIEIRSDGDGWCAADGTAETTFDGPGGSGPVSAEWARIITDNDEPAIEKIACDDGAAAGLRGVLSSLAQVDTTAQVGTTEQLTDTTMRAEILTSHVGPTGVAQSYTFLLDLAKQDDGAWCAKDTRPE